jgi:hypothetical protein
MNNMIEPLSPTESQRWNICDLINFNHREITYAKQEIANLFIKPYSARDHVVAIELLKSLSLRAYIYQSIVKKYYTNLSILLENDDFTLIQSNLTTLQTQTHETTKTYIITEIRRIVHNINTWLESESPSYNICQFLLEYSQRYQLESQIPKQIIALRNHITKITP